MSKKIVCLLMVMVLILASTGIVAYAAQPDRTYTYEEETAVHSTNVYKVMQVVDEATMGTVRMKDPSDIYVDAADRVFILDAGNSRVLVLDKEYKLIHELSEFKYNDETLKLKEGAKGLFFRDSTKMLYIADTGNNRILLTDLEGNVSKIYDKPVDELLDPTTPYQPQKVIVDNMGIMYVTSGSVNTGAMMIDSANNFLGFFGTNKLKLTAAMQLEFFWRSILTDEQNAQSTESFQPVELYNLFWAEDRFVYAVSPVLENMESTVVKLNALGKNVFTQSVDFNEIQKRNDVAFEYYTEGATGGMQLMDITVDDEGVFTVLDLTTCRLYQYDENCNLLAIFGGKGYQKGLFTRPMSLECDSDKNLLVLDAEKCTITVMEQTYYGEKIREANNLFNAGFYEESIEPWMDVLRMNANYTRAYVGLGKAYIGMEQYDQAMDYFKVGKDQSGYAEAKAALRDETVREYFGLVAAVVIIVLISILFFDQIANLFNKISWAIINRKRKGDS